MSYVLTLVRETGILAEDLAFCRRNLCVEKEEWLSKGTAVDFFLDQQISQKHFNEIKLFNKTDVFYQPVKDRQKKALFIDMDATLLNGETLDQVAKHMGVQDKVTAITEQAMRGEIDFISAFKRRISLLRGASSNLFDQVYKETPLQSGAVELVRTLKENGVYIVLISGGLKYFTEKAAVQLELDEHYGNDLVLEGGFFTGDVIDPILNGPVKEKILRDISQKRNLQSSECLAVGDGANDRYMLKAAGCGMGFYPKDRLLPSCDQVIFHNDLKAVLYAQGYRLTCGQVVGQ